MLKRIVGVFFLFLLLKHHSYAQNTVRYHSLANQACKAIENGFLDQGFIFLTEAFALSDKPLAADLLNMAKCYSQMNEPELTEKYIYLAVNRNPIIGPVVRIHFLWFEPVLGSNKWNEIVQMTQKYVAISEEIQQVVMQLKKMDSINRIPPVPPSEFNQQVYWNDVRDRALLQAPVLDSMLHVIINSNYIHSAVEEAFLNLFYFYDTQFFASRIPLFMKLIENGFLTPDILATFFIEQEYGKDSDFNFLSYNPNFADYYDRYGVAFDYAMRSLRLLNKWNYDE